MRPFLIASVLLFPSVVMAQEQVTITLATLAPEDSAWASSLQAFQKDVETRRAGMAIIKLKLGGSLGDENETVLQCKRGQINAASASMGAIASQVPEVNVIELPYLFNNDREVDHILDNVILPRLKKAFEARGLVFGFWSENGWRSFGGRFPVVKVADLKGHKMRSQENPAHLAFWRALGASPVPIPATEALTSLQSGVVDGYDQTPLYAYSAKWHTASKYWSESNHIYQPAVIFYNKKEYDGWSKELKEALDVAGRVQTVALRKKLRSTRPILMINFFNEGVQVNVIKETELVRFREIAAQVRDEYIKKSSAGEKELYKAIQDGLVEFRAQQKQ